MERSSLRGNQSSPLECDVLVIGSGAGGLSTAITAKKNGLDVIVIEKDHYFGGTTAFSGGVLWIPGNHYGKQQNPADTRDAAVTYIKNEAGQFYDSEAVGSFLDHGPAMVDYFERETDVAFVPTLYPDYHPTVPGGVDIGRSILAKPYDIRNLGSNMARLRPPLKSITFMGMMFNSSNADLKHFFNVTKSWTSFVYVTKRLANHVKELVLYRRGIHVTSGNALAARLAKSALDLGIPIYTSTPAKRLVMDGAQVTGALVQGEQGDVTIVARKGVVLACGGFAQDVERIKKLYPHVRQGGIHVSPVPKANTGDGMAMAEDVGATIVHYDSPAAWMPVSRVPFGGNETGVFPHLLDRYKPGMIGVTKHGKRFTNESESYHDVGAAMIKACAGEKETAMWLICDHPTIRKYGLGYAKPAPMPLGGLIAKGYLATGKTIAELAEKTGINAANLEATVRDYNKGAVQGIDTAFGRGTTTFNRYLADPENKPNPCVAPVQTGPFYALKIYMGDLGTFDGIRTNTAGQVLSRDNTPITGLWAVGNDRASVMGGNYPGAGITLGPNMTSGYVTGFCIAGLVPPTATAQALKPEQAKQAASGTTATNSQKATNV